MSARAALAIAKNNFRKIRHDRRTLGMIIVMPLMFMFLFGFTFAGEPTNVRTILVNEDLGVQAKVNTSQGSVMIPIHFSEAIIDNFDAEKLTLVEEDDFDKALDEVEGGRAWAVIHFPANFSQGIVNWADSVGNASSLYPGNVEFNITRVENTNLTLHIDGTNTQVAAAIISEVGGSITETIQQFNPHFAVTSLVRTHFVYGEDARFIDFFAPGIIAITVTMITIILTIVSFVHERTDGTLDRLFISPAKPSDIVFGYTVTFTVIAIFQSVELLAVAWLVFDIAFVGSIILALGLIILYAIGILGLGILLSTLAKNEFQAIQFVPLVFVPSLMLAGILWPIESMPEVIRPISSIIATTYVTEGLRSIMIRGWGAVEIWLDILALVIFAVVTLVGSILLVYKKANRLGVKKN